MRASIRAQRRRKCATAGEGTSLHSLFKRLNYMVELSKGVTRGKLGFAVLLGFTGNILAAEERERSEEAREKLLCTSALSPGDTVTFEIARRRRWRVPRGNLKNSKKTIGDSRSSVPSRRLAGAISPGPRSRKEKLLRDVLSSKDVVPPERRHAF